MSNNNYIDGARDEVCEVNDMLQNLSTVDGNSVLICANCGKDGASNVCAKCKSVRYCNAVCKKVHKKKHKKDCEEYVRLAAEKHNEELRIAAEIHDEKLFKQPPSDDCSICFLRIPTLQTGSKYQGCCGKMICSGCVYAPVFDNQGNAVNNQKCPFCRTPRPRSNEEAAERDKKRMEAGDAIGVFHMGVYYSNGEYGLPQDYTKALELYHRAGELGCTQAYCNIGNAYDYGHGVKVDKEKALHYYKLAAMGGDEIARSNLGIREESTGNFDRALKHYMLAVKNGHADSLQEIQDLFKNGHATKEDYTKALQAYQAYLGEIRSDQRDKAAALYGNCRYY